jgi:hypothetical protein
MKSAAQDRWRGESWSKAECVLFHHAPLGTRAVAECATLFRPTGGVARRACFYFFVKTRSQTPWPSLMPRFSNLVSGR